MTVPVHLRTLVLNSDYIPLSIVHWKKAAKRVFGDDPPVVVEYYDVSFKDTKGREYYVPAIVANSTHVKRNYKKVSFSRKNILKRDGYRCQYCTEKFKANELTIDHVVPRSMWTGTDTPTCWHNLVACCYACNNKKRNRTPEQANMPLKKVVNGVVVPYNRPKRPNYVDLVLGASGVSIDNLPAEWHPYFDHILSKELRI